MKPRPILIFGFGNPGRGDDVLGPMLIETIENLDNPEVECLTAMQLQVEHVTDLVGRDRIIFVDADATCDKPYEYSCITPEKDGSYTTHSMSPTALLYAYRQVFGCDAPQTFLLRVRGYDFDLGAPLSDQAANNLQDAIVWLRANVLEAEPVGSV